MADNFISGQVTDGGSPVENAVVAAILQEDISNLSQTDASEIRATAKLTDANGNYNFGEAELFFGTFDYQVVAYDPNNGKRGQANYPFVEALGIPEKIFYYNGGQQGLGTEWQQGFTQNTAYYEKLEDQLRVRTPDKAGDSAMYGTWEYSQKIDLGSYEELAIEWKNNPANDNGKEAFFGYGTQFGAKFAGNDGQKIERQEFNRLEDVIDISNVSGEFVVFVTARDRSYLNTANANDIRIFKVVTRKA